MVVNQKDLGRNSLVYPDVDLHNWTGNFYCLPIRSYDINGSPWLTGLLLQKTDSKKGQYKRFGAFSVNGEGVCQELRSPTNLCDELYEDASQRTITLI